MEVIKIKPNWNAGKQIKFFYKICQHCDVSATIKSGFVINPSDKLKWRDRFYWCGRCKAYSLAKKLGNGVYFSNMEMFKKEEWKLLEEINIEDNKEIILKIIKKDSIYNITYKDLEIIRTKYLVKS